MSNCQVCGVNSADLEIVIEEETDSFIFKGYDYICERCYCWAKNIYTSWRFGLL